MKILKQKDGKFKVESSSVGKFYTVDLKKGTCTCLHYITRMSKIRGLCKHLEAVKDQVEARDSESYEKIIEYVKFKGEVDSLELINKFGEDAVDDLLSRGELIEERGRVRVLE